MASSSSLLSSALLLPADSEQQLTLLAQLAAQLEADHSRIVTIYPTLISFIASSSSSSSSISNTPASLHLQRWAANLVQSLLCRATLAAPLKMKLALQSLPTLLHLIQDQDLRQNKAGLQAFASVYPLLFKNACSTNDQETWSKIVQLKALTIQTWRNGSLGGKIAAVKVIQRLIQTQTMGSADPRLQRTAEPNLNLCRSNHPFLVAATLEDEANTMLEECVTVLFTSTFPDIVTAVIATLTALLKIRTAFGNLIITALTNWTPAALSQASDAQSRGVEKTVRISLTHLLKTGHANAYISQITEFFRLQTIRMEQAERSRRDMAASRKRQLAMDDLAAADSSKRRKLDGSSAAANGSTGHPMSGPSSSSSSFLTRDNPLGAFNVKALDLQLVIDLVIASFEALSNERLVAAITTTRSNIVTSSVAEVAEAIKPEAAVDPLKLDFDNDELELKIEEEPMAEMEDEPIDDAAALAPFTFNTADDINGAMEEVEQVSDSARSMMLEGTVRRLCSAGVDSHAPAIWIPLVIRLITRGLTSDKATMVDAAEGEEDPRESLRQILFNFVVADFQHRMDFARLWLNEEWFVDDTVRKYGKDRPYDRWLRLLLSHITEHSSNKDKFFAQFIIDLPEIPSEEIERLGEMCMNPEQVQIGFAALRELALLRPSVRDEAVDVLLSLTTHSGKLTRNAAIMTVKRWVPETEPLSTQVLNFALTLYARLEMAPLPAPAPAAVVPAASSIEDPSHPASSLPPPANSEQSSLSPTRVSSPPPAALASHAEVQGGRVVGGLLPPTTLSQVVQHVELLLALCAKSPDLIDHLFENYSRLQPFVQDSLQALMAPMIRSLGATHPKLLSLIHSSPVGSDALVLRLIAIMSEKAPLSLEAIDAIKALVKQRDAGPKFYLAIISHCTKEELLQYLPRVISLLDGSPAMKTLVRGIFSTVVLAPGQAFGTISSNLPPRVRSNDSLAPVELMMLLHQSEKAIGLKSTIEAISICFSMTELFLPETLTAFMQQVVDEDVLPTLFMRTVIQAVSTYKSLQPFVSTTLFSRLIAKKVWETSALWEGFMRCAKVIAPLSFGALLQLPKERLMEVVKKQPTLQEALREHVLKKSGSNSGKSAALLDAIGGGGLDEMTEVDMEMEIQSGDIARE